MNSSANAFLMLKVGDSPCELHKLPPYKVGPEKSCKEGEKTLLIRDYNPSYPYIFGHV